MIPNANGLSLPAGLANVSQVLAAAADSIAITDQEGIILWVNPAFEALTGYPAGEALGRTPSILKSGRHSDAFYADLWGTILRGHVWKGEITNRRRNGSTYVEDKTITPVLGSTGEIEGFVNISRDNSERRRVADALRLALKEAERANAFQRMLLDNLSHEVHTPLAAILGYAEVLRAELSNHHREFARSILESGRQLLETLDSLIELSSLDSGVTRYNPEWFDPDEVIRSVADDHAWKAEAKGIRLTVSNEPHRPARIYQDPILLDRTLHHVLDNAMRYTLEGTIELHVRWRERHLEIVVSDTGRGMPASTTDRVFEPFRRGPSDGHGGGLGVGLAIVKRLVDLMEAQIAVDSQVGVGTTVTLSMRSPETEAQIIALGREQAMMAARQRLAMGSGSSLSAGG